MLALPEDTAALLELPCKGPCLPELPGEGAGNSCGADSVVQSAAWLGPGPAACEVAAAVEGFCPSEPGCTADSGLGAATASVKVLDGVGGSIAPGWLLLLLAEDRAASEVLYGLAGNCPAGGSPLLLPAYGSGTPEPPASITVQKLKSIRNTKAAMTLTQYESLRDGAGISLSESSWSAHVQVESLH